MPVITAAHWRYLCFSSCNFVAIILILFLFFVQAIWRIPANIPPTSARTESMKGIPMMPNIKQKNLPLKVTVAKFPYPENLFKIDFFV